MTASLYQREMMATQPTLSIVSPATTRSKKAVGILIKATAPTNLCKWVPALADVIVAEERLLQPGSEPADPVENVR